MLLTGSPCAGCAGLGGEVPVFGRSQVCQGAWALGKARNGDFVCWGLTAEGSGEGKCGPFSVQP